MIIYVNELNEIKDVGTTNDNTLTPIEILDDDENPFTNWSSAKICCYKVEVNNGHVVMLTSSIDSKAIEYISRLGSENEMLQEQQLATQAQLDYVTMMNDIEI